MSDEKTAESFEALVLRLLEKDPSGARLFGTQLRASVQVFDALLVTLDEAVGPAVILAALGEVVAGRILRPDTPVNYFDTWVPLVRKRMEAKLAAAAAAPSDIVLTDADDGGPTH